MNSKREFRQTVRIYRANVVPRSFDRTVLVDIVKMQLKPIATGNNEPPHPQKKCTFVYERRWKGKKTIHNFELTQIEFIVAQ